MLSLLHIRARKDSNSTCSNQRKSYWLTGSIFFIFETRMWKTTARGIWMMNVLLSCSIRWSKSILSARLLLLTGLLFPALVCSYMAFLLSEDGLNILCLINPIITHVSTIVSSVLAQLTIYRRGNHLILGRCIPWAASRCSRAVCSGGASGQEWGSGSVGDWRAMQYCIARCVTSTWVTVEAQGKDVAYPA